MVRREVALRKRAVECREVVRDTLWRQDADVETIQEQPEAGKNPQALAPFIGGVGVVSIREDRYSQISPIEFVPVD